MEGESLKPPSLNNSTYIQYTYITDILRRQWELRTHIGPWKLRRLEEVTKTGGRTRNARRRSN
jgi:hypothetical protein